MLNNLIEETLNEAKQIGYKKGDRVIVNFNTSKNPQYYIGTVSMVRDGLVHVKFDDGDKGKYKPTKSKTGLIGLAKPNKKRKSEIPADKINSWLLTKPDNKSAVKSNVVQKKNPAGENDELNDIEKPKTNKKEELIADLNKSTRKLNKVFDDSFFDEIGKMIKTNRLGDPFAIIVGTQGFGTKKQLISISCDMKGKINSAKYKIFYNKLNKNLSNHKNLLKIRIPNIDLINARKLTDEKLVKLDDEKSQFADKQNNFEQDLIQRWGAVYTWDEKYDQVLINWDKGFPTWKKLLGVDLNKQKVAVGGSGSKKRWIPFSYIGGFKDSNVTGSLTDI